MRISIVLARFVVFVVFNMLDFMKLATWAGWTSEPEGHPDRGNSATLLVRRVLELDDSQRTEILRYIENLIRDRRT
jgi:hypothetical protein